jgi:Spy/CpxP family protein refolding chaperone
LPGDLGLRGVDLTDAQREQLRGIMENHQAALQQVGTRLRDAHRAFAEAASAQPLDEAAAQRGPRRPARGVKPGGR